MFNDGSEYSQQAWAKLLNPEVLRKNLISASIFLATYEMLKSVVIDRIRNFYAVDFEDGEWVVSDEYRSKCLSRDRSPFQASLFWLRSRSAIDDVDIALVDAIRRHRNELAHDLPKFLMTHNAEVNEKLLGDISQLIAKIDRWWIRAVELDLDPSYEGQQIADEDITSGIMMLVELLQWVATSEDSGKVWDLWQNLSNTNYRRSNGQVESDPTYG